VADLDAAIQLYTDLFGAELMHRASNEADGLAAAFLRAGGAEVELLSPLREDTPVGKFLAKRGSACMERASPSFTQRALAASSRSSSRHDGNPKRQRPATEACLFGDG